MYVSISIQDEEDIGIAPPTGRAAFSASAGILNDIPKNDQVSPPTNQTASQQHVASWVIIFHLFTRVFLLLALVILHLTTFVLSLASDTPIFNGVFSLASGACTPTRNGVFL